MTKQEKPKPRITEASITYEQDADSCATEEQFLSVRTQDAGDGNYIVIQTHRWALELDEIDAFAESLKKVLRMASE